MLSATSGIRGCDADETEHDSDVTMRAYIAQRLLAVIPTVLGATFVLFALLRLLPGDVALMILVGPTGEGSVTPEALAVLRNKLGTDRPISEQYLTWMSNVLRLDLGRSLLSDQPVVDALAQRFPVTFELASLSIVGTALIGVPLGIVMALRRDSWLDYTLRVFTIGGQAVPTFFAATLVIMLLVRWFNWLPPLEYVGFSEDPLSNLVQLAWPVTIIALSGAVVIARLTRSTMLEVLGQEYITTARAKGLRERWITLQHALKNASLPTFSFLGVLFVGELNGTVVLENIFSLPGVGSGLVNAVATRDYPMVEGTLLAIILIVLLTNLLIDVMYRWLDPRIRFG
jgi:peptide/nickel transport system permease protein